ncbi:MAG TPA: L,D-transpeptidase family protein [Kofleriaceae bacterium]|nr:L,D-transpeptidase family protein [Kofleriaceae bacterium]
MRMRWLLFAIAPGIGCAGPHRTMQTTTAPVPTARASAQTQNFTVETEADLPCPDSALVIADGVERGLVCAAEVRAPGVVVDLRDSWTPRLFAPSADGIVPEFRAVYLALAAERDTDGKQLEPTDALAELYGVVPSLAIVRARLADDKRHACHAQIDSAPIKKIARAYGQDHGPQVRAMEWDRQALVTQLEKERVKRKLPDVASLATVGDPKLAQALRRLEFLEGQHAGIIALQKHLVCEGLLSEKDTDGMVTWKTGVALELFQRRNFLLPNNRMDRETVQAILTDSRELDYRFALRVLRERVVDATNLIEDGTAGDGPKPILGRMLDPAAMRAARGHETPLPNAAPDLVSAATEAAAKQLGWTGPGETLAFLTRHPGGLQVSIELPPAPAYHGKHMDLSAEIDRGDVYYDPRPIGRIVERRPNLVVYANDNGTKRALVRWPTTIGGWADVRMPSGYVVQKWKESDVGPRVWKTIYAAPTWLPPPTTPDRDLVRNLYNGHWDLKRSILGPGPHAAYGMVLIEHLNPVKVKRNGVTVEEFWDNGIGTHGSASVTSIVNGTSHGCHRLYNQLAVRLANFLLEHRDHEVKGQQKEVYRRTVRHKGVFQAKIDTRGFLYELTPPVPVNVLKGNIRSQRNVPPRSSAPASN